MGVAGRNFDLVGDVGGAKARFALVDNQGHIRQPRSFLASEYPSLEVVLAEYLEQTVGRQKIARAVIAVPGPVLDGESEFTNLAWRISETDLLARFGFQAVRLINDFAAQALACPLLGPDDLHALGPSLQGGAEHPVIVLGAGNGFGVASLAPGERADVIMATEGGHAGFAPYDDVEVEIWRNLQARYGRVSIERLLSGPGLFDLYLSLGEIRGENAKLADYRKVLEAASAGDLIAGLALDRFCAILGSVAGDFALSLGAQGGVFISGTLVPRISSQLAGGQFRRRFEDKGRLSSYLAQIPTTVVLHPYPAIVGCSRELAQMN